MAATTFLLLFPLLAFVGAQQASLDERIAEAEKNIEESKLQTAKEIEKVSTELAEETKTYITKAHERFVKELQLKAETSKENIFTNTRTSTAHAVANRPTTVAYCIYKAHGNGINNVNGHLQDYSTKLDKNQEQAIGEVERINGNVQILGSAVPDAYAVLLASVKACKEEKCVDKSNENTKKVTGNFKIHYEKLSDEMKGTRVTFNKNQDNFWNQGVNKIQSAENSAIRGITYC